MSSLHRRVNELTKNMGWDVDFFNPSSSLVEVEPQIKMNVSSDDNLYYFDFFIPGVKKEDITLEVVNKILSIQYTRTPYNDENKKQLVQEMKSGSFKRSIKLLDDASFASESVSAVYHEGILHVSILRTTKGQSSKISIK